MILSNKNNIIRYSDEIDLDIVYYIYIPDEYFKEFSIEMNKKINQTEIVRENDIKESIKNFIIKKYLEYDFNEEMINETSKTFKQQLFYKNYFFYDYSDIYGFATQNKKCIPFDETYKKKIDDAYEIIEKNKNRCYDIFKEVSDNKPIKYLDLRKASAKLLIEEGIASSEEMAELLVQVMINQKRNKGIILEISEEVDNPNIKILTKEEIKEEKEKNKKEIEQKLLDKKKEREKIKQKREELYEQKEREEKEKYNRRMNDLKKQYYNEIVRMLKVFPGSTCADLYEKSPILKEMTGNTLDLLMDLLRYLEENKDLGVTRVSGRSGLYFYVNDGSIDVEELKQKKSEEWDRIMHPEKYRTATKSGCYVATCIYGTYDCPEVWTLRRYRDYNLSKTWYGRLFIRTYYIISPRIVKLFGNTNWFKKMWKPKLDKKVKKLKNLGYESTPYKDMKW